MESKQGAQENISKIIEFVPVNYHFILGFRERYGDDGDLTVDEAGSTMIDLDHEQFYKHISRLIQL